MDYNYYDYDYDYIISDLDYSHYDNVTWYWLQDDLPDPPSLKAKQVVAMVIYVVVFVVGVPGNALVLWVTVSEAQRSVNAIWFLNLALADLLSCLSLPIHFMIMLLHGNWLLGDTSCRILPSLFNFNLYASVLLLATISADRFLLVFKPIWCKNYHVARWAWLASGVVWIMALMLTIPYFVFGRFYEDSKKAFCHVNFGLGGPELPVTIVMTLFVLTFLVPLVTMSICYTLLLLRAWRRPATRSTKTLKMVVAMVTSFFVFWLPYQLSKILYVFPLQFYPIWEFFSSLKVVWVALAYVNFCINPIFYVAASGGLHIQVFKFRPGQLCKLLTED